MTTNFKIGYIVKEKEKEEIALLWQETNRTVVYDFYVYDPSRLFPFNLLWKKVHIWSWTFFLGWNGLIDSLPFHSTISVSSTKIFGPIFRKFEWNDLIQVTRAARQSFLFFIKD